MQEIKNTNTKGVRDNIDLIKRIIIMAPDLEEDLRLSVADGFSRYPEWPELKKVKKWLDF